MSNEYLGDGVYVEIVRGDTILLTTDRGGKLDAIYLEPEVYHALIEFVERAKAEAAKP